MILVLLFYFVISKILISISVTIPGKSLSDKYEKPEYPSITHQPSLEKF